MLADSLPVDSTEISWVGGGVRIDVHRCSKLKMGHNGFRGEPVRVLTGGVQIVARTETPQYGPSTVHESRLRLPWTREALAQRIETALRRVQAQRQVDLARDAVHTRLLLVRHSPHFERSWLAHARATGLPLLIDLHEMTEAQCAAWLAWLAERS